MPPDPPVIAAAAPGAAPPSSAGTAAEQPIPALVSARIWLVRALLVGWIRIFSLSGLWHLGRFFGLLEYLCDYKRRRRVRRKLYSMFRDEHPPGWYREMTLGYFMRIRCDKMFYTIMDRIPRGKLMKRIKLKGARHLDAALARHRGVYVALCHFGSFHVAGLLGALSGYHIVGVRDPKESPVRRYIQRKYRETFPEVARMKLLYSTSFPRQIYRELQSGLIVASLLDVDRSRGDNTRTCPVRIFGETRDFLTGPVQMALRCGAPTLQAFVVSRRNFYFQMIITPPLLEPDHAGDEAQTISEVLQRYASGVEAFARAHPDHVMNI
jgi:lauroyl/myristoyl acyltransferase